MSRDKKEYFRVPKVSEVLTDDPILADRDLLNTAQNLGDNSLIITTRLVDRPRMHRKYGEEIRVDDFQSVDEAVEAQTKGWTLRNLIADSYNEAALGFYSNYALYPVGTQDDKVRRSDLRKRKVPLVEIIEGIKLLHYAAQRAKGITVLKAYDDTDEVAAKGVTVKLRVPSRSIKQQRYEFNAENIPLSDNEQILKIALDYVTSHNCADKDSLIQYKVMSPDESPHVFLNDAHDIAAYFAVAQHYAELGNDIPTLASPFLFPNTEMLKLYERFFYQAVTLKNQLGKVQKSNMRPLNTQEMEVLMQAAVIKLGFDRMIGHDLSPAANYSWRSDAL